MFNRTCKTCHRAESKRELPILSFLFSIAISITVVKAPHFVNLALHKPTAQGPATWNNDHDPSLYISSKAVDGKVDLTSTNHCTHTTNADLTWWLVDLGVSSPIHRVAVLNRDAYSDRLRNFTIDVFQSDPKLEPIFPGNVGEICARQVDPVGSSQWVEFDCNNGSVIGRFLRLIKFGFRSMSLCEVRVLKDLCAMESRNTYRHVPNTKSLSESREVLGVFSTPMQCGLTLWQRNHHLRN
ncbi:F5/8 type c domain-containing protein [Plakobranchus ocellatus]|uniref:F5/8 type c domain-containing protein n=1 Tax=Plakobranchus ocellatus TaxID=259542 RepID=A0AAV3YN21_9GAST|nr:F5/8 type c domain-containing protein [Plakobranchus ocellatus]